MPCNNISNAGAVTYNVTRYIFYNESFMQSVKLNNWTNMAILAHEVGHHINGHTLKLDNLEQQRNEELEADNFSGFILSKLGASLAQTIELTKIFPRGDDTYSSHPTRSKRIIAYTNGWNKGKENKSINKIPEEYDTRLSEKSAEEFYNQGNKKLREKDYSAAIINYNSAIEINPKFVGAYNNRGNAKRAMYEIIAAIRDYSQAILIEPNFIMAYANRGNAKSLIKDYKGAISDLSKVINLDDSDIPAYYDRGHNRAQINDYIGAIADFDKFIELSPDDGYAYYYRGSLKFEVDDFFGACKDLRAGASLGDEDASRLLKYKCD